MKVQIQIEIEVDHQHQFNDTLDAAVSHIKRGVLEIEETSLSGSFKVQVQEVDPLWKVLTKKAFERKGLEASDHDFHHVRSEGWPQLSYTLMLDKIEDYASEVANS